MFIAAPKVMSEDAGFSLLETLVALMIMAIASLALFQSTTAMLSLSDRAVRTGERTLDNALTRRALSGVLAGLIPPWRDEHDTAFTANARQMSGFTAQGLSAVDTGASRFTLYLDRSGPTQTRLVYRTETASARGRRSAAQTTEAPWVIKDDIPPGAEFTYQDDKGVWHSVWPAPAPKARAFDNLAAVLDTPPLLPAAIALKDTAARGGERYVFYVPITHHTELPPRMDLGLPQLDGL